MERSEEWWKVRDLPQRLGPMVTKELRQGLRRGIFLLPFIGIQIFAIAAMVLEFQMGGDEIEKSTPYDGPLNFLMFLPGEMFSGPFWVVVGVICLVLMPLGGLLLMSEEVEEGNHELLLMTPLSRWQVVKGKFFTLWGLCLLTLSSLLPYAIVRYFIGGIDVGRNLNLALTVILGSGIFVAGTIGASSFQKMIARIAILGLFLGSLLFSLFASVFFTAMVTEEAGLFFHLNAYAISFCYIVLGLAIARSRIRLVVHFYEVKPSWMLIGLLFFTPFVIGLTSLMTIGYGGFVGSIGMGLVVWFADVTPKAPSWVEAPEVNVPPLPDSP